MCSCSGSYPPRATRWLFCSAGEHRVRVQVLRCSQPCAALTNSRDINWDTSQWSAIIDDRQFLSWLVKIPSETEQLRAKQMSMAQISKLEDLWRENPQAKLEDAEVQNGEEEMQPILIKWA